jgi:hypothetical protein
VPATRKSTVRRIPRRVQQYLDHARRHGPEEILETAEFDEDLTDEEWGDLWQRMHRWTERYRWNEKTRKWEDKPAAKPIICEGCGEIIPPSQINNNGRRRKYHDNNGVCKQLAYRKRQAREASFR